jgi:hypothetical protein
MELEQSTLALHLPVVAKPAFVSPEFGESRTQAAVLQQKLGQLAAEMQKTASFVNQALRHPQLQTSSPQAVLERLASLSEQLAKARQELRPHAIRATSGQPS